jgi:malate dehydrogenase (oxaloacetate-decarboxylating)
MLYRRQDSTDGRFIETDLFGYELLNDPLLNKGTAFTDEERDAFDLHGLLPPHVATLDEQVARHMQAFRQLPSDLSIDRIGARSGRRVLW